MTTCTTIVYLVWSGATILRAFTTRRAASAFATLAKRDGAPSVRVTTIECED